MDSAVYELVIGNKTWSSWSMRPWLAMKAAGIPFREIAISLRTSAARERILEHSPSGRVPALKTPDGVVWDSLAIIEYLNERHGEAGLWPADGRARAMARSISAEMHSGFHVMRKTMPMDLLSFHPTPEITPALADDLRRIVVIWSESRAAHGAAGPYLFGAFSAADAMFAPVATRLRTYGVDLRDFGDDGPAAAYAQTVLDHPAVAEWTAGAHLEVGSLLPAGGAFN